MGFETFFADLGQRTLRLPSGAELHAPNAIERFCQLQDPDKDSTLVLSDGIHPSVSIGEKLSRGGHPVGVRNVRIEAENEHQTTIEGKGVQCVQVWEKTGSLGQENITFGGLHFFGSGRYLLERAWKQQRETQGLFTEDCWFEGDPTNPPLSSDRRYNTSGHAKRNKYERALEHVGIYWSSVPGDVVQSGIWNCTMTESGSSPIQIVNRVGKPGSDSNRSGRGPFFIVNNDITDACDPKSDINDGNPHNIGGSCIHVAGHPGRVVITSNRVTSKGCGALVVWGDNGKGIPPFVGDDQKGYHNRIVVVDKNRLSVVNGDRELVQISDVWNLKFGRNGLESPNKPLVALGLQGMGGGIGKITRWDMHSSDKGWRGDPKVRKWKQPLSDQEIDALYASDGASW